MKKKMVATCPSCKSDMLSFIGDISATDKFAGRLLPEPLFGGSFFLCNDCRLGFRHPRMTKEELDRLYCLGESDIWEDQINGRTDWKIAASFISTYHKGSRILDVGCFDGRFLDFLGPGLKRFGIEIHEDAVRRARRKGIDIIGKDYAVLEKSREDFDVITAMDLIEHVPDPNYLLRLLGNAIKPGGIIIVSTGNTQALSWRLMGSRYWYCTFAEHISFINPAWCHLAAKQDGLTVEKIMNFSHSATNRRRQLEELAKNIAYKLVPSLTTWLRMNGFGGKDAKKYTVLANHPPSWSSAKDHIIVLFRKQGG
jgi:2-polyprenyl-3-methyl-5-hydroxy-6-metoxy-1,4-benzoquinol methylase